MDSLDAKSGGWTAELGAGERAINLGTLRSLKAVGTVSILALLRLLDLLAYAET